MATNNLSLPATVHHRQAIRDLLIELVNEEELTPVAAASGFTFESANLVGQIYGPAAASAWLRAIADRLDQEAEELENTTAH